MLKLLIRFLLRLLYRLDVHGTVPSTGKRLIVANHQSFLDAPILYSFLPADTLWVVHSQIARIPAFRFMLKAINHVVIDTTSPFAIKATVELIESGKPVVIFPEGRVTVTGSLMKVYDGPAFMAAKTGAQIVTVIFDGASRARLFSRMSGDYQLAWFPKITAKVFPAETIAMPDAPNGKLRRRKAGEAMRRLLQRCLCASRPKRSLHTAFLDAVELHGRSRDMVEDVGGAHLTYGGLLKGALALGRLAGKVSQPDDVVGVLLPNAAATLALVLGLFGARRIPALLNFTAGVDGLQSAIRAARIRTILTSRAFLERGKLQPVVDKLRDVEIVLLEDLRQRLTLADKLWLVLYALRFPRAATADPDPDSPAVVLFTSGSEGKPKGVVLSHWNIMSNLEQILTTVDVSRADKIFSAMPAFHSFGLTAGLMLPAVSGIRLYLYPSPLHYAVVPELFYDRDATIIFATPTFLKHYAKRAHPYDFRKARILLAGAEKLTDEVRQVYMEKFGIRILEGYGATECSPGISIGSYMKFRTGAIGELLPLMESRLEPVPGVPVGGLLHVRGPNVMLGYWRDSNPRVLEPPSSVLGPGWYPTGDLASIDEDGFISLLGRVKRFAKVAGEMVSLEVVENVAGAASPSAMHGAVARPDSSRGEMVILATQDRNLKREQLQQAARSIGAPDFAIPRRIVYVDKIPLLGTGKKDYPKLAVLVEELLDQPNA
ncbi:MAG: AMP-binding protein [Acidobacteria bacterium]|nr:AMP-binding protein [Acidobacteriota bacterium]